MKGLLLLILNKQLIKSQTEMSVGGLTENLQNFIHFERGF